MAKTGTQEFIQEQIRKHRDDPHRKAFFIAVSANELTTKNIDKLYDFESGSIKPQGLRMGWQTGESTRITRFAFNLYNGFVTGSDCTVYTPYFIFSHDVKTRAKQFEAINALFGG
jgi:hypothetical protein